MMMILILMQYHVTVKCTFLLTIQLPPCITKMMILAIIYFRALFLLQNSAFKHLISCSLFIVLYQWHIFFYPIQCIMFYKWVREVVNKKMIFHGQSDLQGFSQMLTAKPLRSAWPWNIRGFLRCPSYSIELFVSSMMTVFIILIIRHYFCLFILATHHEHSCKSQLLFESFRFIIHISCTNCPPGYFAT